MIKCQILLTDCHDDFEPNTQAKQNRGSVWVYTVTIVGPPGSQNQSNYSYPIAIGSKNVNHDHIIDKIQNELQTLKAGNTKIYHRQLKKKIQVSVLHLLSIADSPERRSKNYITLGNGEFTARWGYAANVNMISPQLPHCNYCLKAQVLQPCTEITLKCEKCLQWNFMSENIELLTFESPVSRLKIDKTIIEKICFTTPKLLTYEYLRSIITFVLCSLLNSKITLKSAVVLLKSSGLNDELINKMKSYLNEHNDDSVTFQENDPVVQDFIPPQLKYKEGPINESYIDAIMHLVFYGTGGSSISEITRFLKLKKKHSSFVTFANEITSTLINLRLSWCKLLPYNKGTFGGWVAENWIAYLRVCKWIYGQVDTLKSDPLYKAPDKNVSTWNMKENVAWLRAHGISYEGNASEVKTKVKRLKGSINEPKVIGPTGGSFQNVVNVLNSMIRMISLLMSDKMTDDTAIQCECSIKIYLSMVNKLDNELPKENGMKPCWVSKSNFLSLLNLPKQMRLYGPMRRYWEGGYRGEGLIQDLKPLIKNGLCLNWQVNTLKFFYNLRALSFFDEETKNGTKINSKKNYYGMHHVYDSIKNIEKIYQRREVLSIYQQNNNVFLVRVDKETSIQIVKAEHRQDLGKMSYFKWNIHPNEILKNLVSMDTIRHCLLLPLLFQEKGIEHDGIYACIDSDWNELQEKGFAHPKGINEKDLGAV